MPASPFGVPNQFSEARARQLIRHILDQEVRRLLDANASVQTQVDTNTSNISANAAAISTNVTAIENNQRRGAERDSHGLFSTAALNVATEIINLKRRAAARTNTGIWSSLDL